MDWEAELTALALQQDGVQARYQSAVDGEPDGVVDLPDLTVLFQKSYVAVNALGVPIDDVEILAQGPRSALSVARVGGLLTVDGHVYVVRSKPRDDGVVWIKLMLEGPIG